MKTIKANFFFFSLTNNVVYDPYGAEEESEWKVTLPSNYITSFIASPHPLNIHLQTSETLEKRGQYSILTTFHSSLIHFAHRPIHLSTANPFIPNPSP